MKKVVHRSDTRGRSVYDWLDSHHSFSFDEYYNPERVHFGALRVLNDDRVPIVDFLVQNLTLLVLVWILYTFFYDMPLL